MWRQFGPVLLLIVFALGRLGHAEPPKVEDHVLLKSGHALAGRVTGEVKLDIGRAYRVQTDFGEILVPKSAAKTVVTDRDRDPDETFSMRRIRVVRFKGNVERRPKGAETWKKIAWTDKYGKDLVNRPNAIVAPGDTIRTGEESEIDLMPHKDVWIRIAGNSEVEIPAHDPSSEEGSLSLKQGRTIQEINGRPRGQLFRVRTPLALLSTEGARFRVRVSDDVEGAAVDEGVVGTSDSVTLSGGESADWTAVGVDERPFDNSEFELELLRFSLDDMTLIPGGRYTLGGNAKESIPKSVKSAAWTDAVQQISASDFERSVDVEIEPYLIDRRETTEREFLAFSKIFRLGMSRVASPGGPDFPGVTTFEDAVRFARWRGGSLPSEAQWEAAARGKDGRRFPWGAAIPKSLEDDPDFWKQRRRPEAPGFDISPFGVRGMVSSPSEWTRSKWADPQFLYIMDSLARRRTHSPEAQPPEQIPVYRGPSVRRRRGDIYHLQDAAGVRLVLELGE